jgi:hypothetical protein
MRIVCCRERRVGGIGKCNGEWFDRDGCDYIGTSVMGSGLLGMDVTISEQLKINVLECILL